MLRIQTLCKEKGISLKELSEGLGITYQSLHDSINGNPTLKRLQDIASILGVSVKDLFEDKSGESGFSCPHCGRPIEIELKAK